MTLQINMNPGSSANGGVGVGVMTSAGNPWTVADALAQTLVNQGRASPLNWPAEVPGLTSAEILAFRTSVSGGGAKGYTSQLPNWFIGGLSGKKLAMVGDSTTYLLQVGTANLNYINNQYVANPGSPLYGVTLQWFGANGNTLANFLANAPSGYGIQDVIAAAPNAVILSYGINDVRLAANGWTLATFTAQLKSAVNQILAALPKCDIVLRMPNSFLTTDVGAAGYVVPNSNAQAASDILRLSYQACIGQWPNVIVWDSRNIFPNTCPALSSSMTDQLHPSITGASGSGFQQIIDGTFSLLGVSQYAPQALINDAQTASYTADFSTFPNVVYSSGDYSLVTSGAWVTQGSTYLIFSGNQNAIGSFRTGDVVWQNGQAAFALPFGFTQTASGANIQLGGLGAGVPSYAQAGGVVAVYRRTYAGIFAAKSYVGNAQYPYSVRLNGAVAAGNGYIRIQTNPYSDYLSAAAMCAFSSSDTMLHPTLGAVSLSGSSVSEFSNDTLQINKGGTDFTMPAGASEVFIVGASRRVIQDVLDFAYAGALASAVVRQVVAVGGIFTKCQATLGTAGSTTTTVVIARNGTTVLTLTFAASATTPTLTWAAASQFICLPGRTITATITAGTGAADLAIAVSA